MDEIQFNNEFLKDYCIRGDIEVVKLVMDILGVDRKFLKIGEGPLRSILLSTLMQLEEREK